MVYRNISSPPKIPYLFVSALQDEIEDSDTQVTFSFLNFPHVQV